jgi:hypothetical protein
MILGRQQSDSSAIAAASFKGLESKITTAKADISTLPGSGHLNFALTLEMPVEMQKPCTWHGP